MAIFMKPIVAIVGRPNVGKSTLFNRIVGRRTAITLDQPGVTRDRHYGQASWDGHDFLVVDTGGFFLDEKGLQKKIREQIEVALAEASLLLFVLDGREGLHPEDARIAVYLRRLGKKVFFVVNKIDLPNREELLADFYRLGEDLYPVSAEDGLRVNDLLDEVVKHIPTLALP
jgi:GTP-binding protein